MKIYQVDYEGAGHRFRQFFTRRGVAHQTVASLKKDKEFFNIVETKFEITIARKSIIAMLNNRFGGMLDKKE